MVSPYKDSPDGKKAQVQKMFNTISGSYDFLNHLLSFNIDKIWRKSAIKILSGYKPQSIIDVATGTGDFAIAASKLSGVKITGVDISEGMLEIAEKKIRKRKLESTIHLVNADSEFLPFRDNLFNAAIVGFGIRNFENLERGLQEIFRILHPGGVLIILEFSKPGSAPFRQFYSIYFRHILPFVGRIISRDSFAYKYLPESVEIFPQGKEMLEILQKCGFFSSYYRSLTFGIASIYVGEKGKKEQENQSGEQ